MNKSNLFVIFAVFIAIVGIGGAILAGDKRAVVAPKQSKVQPRHDHVEVVKADPKVAEIGRADDFRITLFIDPINRCQYLVHRDSMVPRMAADGKQMCRKVAQ